MDNSDNTSPIMRSNGPVTQHAYERPDGVTLMSVTDRHGRLTDVNAKCIAVSGFDRDELIGEPHHVARHPDMPAEAFADRWATWRAGLSWRGERVENIAAGSARVDQAGGSINGTIAEVARVASMLHDISAATREQSGAPGEVNVAIAPPDRTTQHHAALAGQSAAAAQRLRDANAVFRYA